jgi:hypothetical protein
VAINKYDWHILVLPEDKADRQLAIGFLLEPSVKDTAIQVLPPAGGWTDVRDQFSKIHIRGMNDYGKRYMVLLIDFDGREDRLEIVRRVIPDELKDRVIVIGVWKEPEDLKKELGCGYEEIGLRLASDCQDRTNITWDHPLLIHNADEVSRMTEVLKPILFPSE